MTTNYINIYFIKMLKASKKISKYLNNMNLGESMHAWFVTGFIDAEGCFFIGIQKSNKVKTN